MDVKIIQVALNGLENILKVGQADAQAIGSVNKFAVMIEECYGLDKIEFLQSHENMEIYRKVFDMIEDYFGSEEEDTNVAPSVDPNAPQQFQFNPAQPPAFDFWDKLKYTAKLINTIIGNYEIIKLMIWSLLKC